MNRNTDHRDNLEYIRSLFEADDIHAPDALSEDSILAAIAGTDAYRAARAI